MNKLNAVDRIKDVKFSEKTAYRGRNGKGIQLGMGIQSYEMGEAQIVVLNPINSRNCVTDSAVLRIPSQDIPKVIEALKQVTGTKRPTPDEIGAIEDQVLARWEGRRLEQGYKMSHITTKRYQAEFLMGMVATMEAIYGNEGGSLMSPKVLFGIMRGDYIK